MSDADRSPCDTCDTPRKGLLHGGRPPRLTIPLPTSGRIVILIVPNEPYGLFFRKKIDGSDGGASTMGLIGQPDLVGTWRAEGRAEDNLACKALVLSIHPHHRNEFHFKYILFHALCPLQTRVEPPSYIFACLDDRLSRNLRSAHLEFWIASVGIRRAIGVAENRMETLFSTGEDSGADEVLDAARAHQLTAARRNGCWEFIARPS
ncbi:MAG: hypothetical protein QOJ42_744 [Acidobacteriaceae bacterium]|jgi:hypothetical protein|nr:hypothetical protein [Acidobacteriaceae bacterium]MEA2959082.1 hypothetical protein [Alphaproteobacteria bacterium]